jgi:D-alanyl-D-alanine carboxypeptidase/D-alanyl-D-alanine-endopeptidase (penicillin-binding protein 4)
MKFFLSLMVLVIVLSGCSVQKPIVKPYQNIQDLFNQSAVLNKHHVGFVLKENGKATTMIEKNANLYFTPASNTKLFTFYTALNMLGDSVPSIQYIIRKDSLIVWPMADASFLHPDFKTQKSFDFIKEKGKNIFLVTGRYQGEKYGNGWIWGDYNDYYQTEKSEMPLYGNVLNVTTNATGTPTFNPDLPNMFVGEFTTSNQAKAIKRSVFTNDFAVPKTYSANFSQSIPLVMSKTFLETILTDTLLATGSVYKPVVTLPWRKVPASANIVYSVATDTLYKHMLQPSDNFIAEQILLNCAVANKMTMNTDSVISFAKKSFLNDLPDQPVWIDGSGLSRYNLFTPQDMVAILEKISAKVNNDQRLFELLPAGGKSGTLRNMFKDSPEPYVFAKSGSLANNYCLSGYLIGKSGKKYLFSFMNNNFTTSTAAVRDEVAKVLTFIHNNY